MTSASDSQGSSSRPNANAMPTTVPQEMRSCSNAVSASCLGTFANACAIGPPPSSSWVMSSDRRRCSSVHWSAIETTRFAVGRPGRERVRARVVERVERRREQPHGDEVVRVLALPVGGPAEQVYALLQLLREPRCRGQVDELPA